MHIRQPPSPCMLHNSVRTDCIGNYCIKSYRHTHIAHVPFRFKRLHESVGLPPSIATRKSLIAIKRPKTHNIGTHKQCIYIYAHYHHAVFPCLPPSATTYSYTRLWFNALQCAVLQSSTSSHQSWFGLLVTFISSLTSSEEKAKTYLSNLRSLPRTGTSCALSRLSFCCKNCNRIVLR